ncbi:hypothetical protein B0H13DRAFT_1869613 [Mycena leptocephala]|nr:hypothetical protein B0H13DRAFT_1869613 [Mycena leptocephala]
MYCAEQAPEKKKFRREFEEIRLSKQRPFGETWVPMIMAISLKSRSCQPTFALNERDEMVSSTCIIGIDFTSAVSNRGGCTREESNTETMTTAKSPLSAIPCQKEWDKPVTVAARSFWLGLCVNVRKAHTNRSACISLIWAEEKYIIEIEERRRKKVRAEEASGGDNEDDGERSGVREWQKVLVSVVQQLKHLLHTLSLNFIAASSVCMTGRDGTIGVLRMVPGRGYCTCPPCAMGNGWGAYCACGGGARRSRSARAGGGAQWCCGRRNGTVGRGGVRAGAEAGGVETAEWSREEAADGEGEPERVGREAGTRGIHMESGVYSKLGGRGIGIGRAGKNYLKGQGGIWGVYFGHWRSGNRGERVVQPIRPTEDRIIRENAGDAHGERRKVVGGREKRSLKLRLVNEI